MARAADDPGAGMVRVWDPLVRVVHWTLAAAVLGAFMVERPRDLHEALGWLALGAVALRLVWGTIGSRPARFASFVPGPAALVGYLHDMLRGCEQRRLGHNPAGGAMIVALLAAVAMTGITGWMMGTDAWFGASWVEDAHEALANLTLGLAALHVAGVVYASLRHRENLVRAMITGDKHR